MKFKSPFLVLLVLVGCGGNDDNNITPSQPNPPSPNQGIPISGLNLIFIHLTEKMSIQVKIVC